jgi:hypothetical protein
MALAGLPCTTPRLALHHAQGLLDCTWHSTSPHLACGDGAHRVGVNVFAQTAGNPPTVAGYQGSAVMGLGKAAMAAGLTTNRVVFINPSTSGELLGAQGLSTAEIG